MRSSQKVRKSWKVSWQCFGGRTTHSEEEGKLCHSQCNLMLFLHSVARSYVPMGTREWVIFSFSEVEFKQVGKLRKILFLCRGWGARVYARKKAKKMYVNEMKGERLSYFSITSCLCRWKVRKYHFIIYKTFQVYKTGERRKEARWDWTDKMYKFHDFISRRVGVRVW